jgi:hypothetical protein
MGVSNGEAQAAGEFPTIGIELAGVRPARGPDYVRKGGSACVGAAAAGMAPRRAELRKAPSEVPFGRELRDGGLRRQPNGLPAQGAVPERCHGLFIRERMAARG